MKMLTPILLAAIFLGPAAAAEEAAKPCATSEHRQFDFWIGEWTVTTPDGKPAGRNSITPIMDGCALHESWTSVGTTTGQSFNIYDANGQRWHQTWVDSGGNLLQLDGGLVDGAMVMSGTVTVNGAAQTHRITWTPNADGTVRQYWQSSADGGKTWQDLFDGRYAKAAP